MGQMVDNKNNNILMKFELKLVSDSWGKYKKGDVDTFYIKLLGDDCGLLRHPIDKQWEVVSCEILTQEEIDKL